MSNAQSAVPLVPLEGLYHYVAAARGEQSDSDNGNTHQHPSGERLSPTNNNNNKDDSAAISLLSDPASSSHGSSASSAPPSKKSRFLRHLPEGWRFGVTLGAVLSGIALIINASVAGSLYAWMRRNGYGESRIPPIFTGHCDKASRYSTALHLAINVLSSLLLGASNYAMQCLSAPTRRSIDKAHRKGRWLDVGVQSVKNMRSVGPKKLFLWTCLALSSVPLHLVYNSTFFVSTTSNYYDVYIAAPSFATAPGTPYLAPFDATSDITVQQTPAGTLITRAVSLGGGYTEPSAVQAAALDPAGPYERLDPAACIAAYAQPILAQRRTVILVTADRANCTTPGAQAVEDATSETSGMRVCASDESSLFRVRPIKVAPVAVGGEADWFAWLCDGMVAYDVAAGDNCANHAQEVAARADEWQVEGWRVSYCLSEVLQDQCSVRAAVDLVVVVCVFNAVKVLVLVLVVVAVRDEPLITVGDAVASFVRTPDEVTRGWGLVDKEDVVKNRGRKTSQQLQPKPYEAVAPRRWRAASKARWAVLSILMFIAIAAVLGLLGFAIKTLNDLYGRGDAASIREFGLGKLTPYTVILGWAIPSTGDAAVVATVLIVNLPQALLSLLYLLLNATVTCMALAAEWNRYGLRRRALRVSRPAGQQRTTYFLQVPYALGVPLMGASMLLHWLISQSFFLAKIEVADAVGVPQDDPSTSPTTAAYSPLGMILTALVGVAVMAAAMALGARTLRPGIPLAGSCSLAVAAACHAPEGTSERASLLWGVVPEEGHGFGLRHCAFSDKEVELPAVGSVYA